MSRDGSRDWVSENSVPQDKRWGMFEFRISNFDFLLQRAQAASVAKRLSSRFAEHRPQKITWLRAPVVNRKFNTAFPLSAPLRAR